MENLSCPLPGQADDHILLAHGGGGRLMQQLIARVFQPAFGGGEHDGAVLPPAAGRLAFTTDSYVVDPLFFPGGDIGELAVNGTVNDLAVSGARALWLSAAFVVEEGKAAVRSVELGFEVGERIEIRKGLVAGDEVVIRGNERLQPGAPVQVASPGT